MPNLTTVTLPAGLTGIPKDAFANSAKLATVKFGDASANTPGAKEGVDNAITLPTGITTIDPNAFAGTAATAVDLSKVTGLTSIADNVFKGMASLTEVKLPSTVTSIGQNAFQNDANLVKLSMEAATTGGSSVQAREENAATTAKFGKSLTNIGQNAFNGTGFTTVDLSAAVGTPGSTGSTGGNTPATTLTVNSGAFTNMANLETVKLPAKADINPTYFGNPADGEQKLASIKYGTDSSTDSATITLSDQNISSLNFSKITNQTIEIKSNTSSAINFNGGVFNGNSTMTTLKLNVIPRNGNGSL